MPDWLMQDVLVVRWWWALWLAGMYMAGAVSEVLLQHWFAYLARKDREVRNEQERMLRRVWEYAGEPRNVGRPYDEATLRRAQRAKTVRVRAR